MKSRRLSVRNWRWDLLWAGSRLVKLWHYGLRSILDTGLVLARLFLKVALLPWIQWMERHSSPVLKVVLRFSLLTNVAPLRNFWRSSIIELRRFCLKHLLHQSIIKAYLALLTRFWILAGRLLIVLLDDLLECKDEVLLPDLVLILWGYVLWGLLTRPTRRLLIPLSAQKYRLQWIGSILNRCLCRLHRWLGDVESVGALKDWLLLAQFGDQATNLVVFSLLFQSWPS